MLTIRPGNSDDAKVKSVREEDGVCHSVRDCRAAINMNMTVRKPMRQSLIRLSKMTDQTIARMRIAMELPRTMIIIIGLEVLTIQRIRIDTTEMPSI